jgi:hypothetical protein
MAAPKRSRISRRALLQSAAHSAALLAIAPSLAAAAAGERKRLQGGGLSA